MSGTAAAGGTGALGPSDEQLDRVGMTASILCAVHCVSAAAIAAAVPALRVIESGWVERLLIAAALVVAAVAIRRGVAVHHDRRAYVALGIGAVVLVAGRLASSERVELVSSLIGAAALVVGHVINIRALRRRCCADGSDQQT